MKLYEIGDEYRECLRAVEAGEIPEDAIADTLEGIQAAFEVKAESVACLVKELLAESQAIGDEASKLAERARRKKAEADRLAQYIYRQMAGTGIPKIETARARLTIMRTPPACVIDDEAALMQHLLDKGMDDCVKRDVSVRKSELAKRLKAGAAIPGAHMQAGERLDIK